MAQISTTATPPAGNSDLPKGSRDGWRAFLPAAGWLASYQARWLGPDLLAGITLAAYAIPVSLAYAGLAGLSPVVGIYGYLLGGLAYALFGSSRHLAIGPTSAISLMLAGTVAQMAGGDAQRYAQIATLAGFVVAFLSIVAWGIQASSLTAFISETNLLGFKAGAALSIATTQLPALFGVAGGGADFFERVVAVAAQLGQLSVSTTIVGLAAILLLLLGDAFLPGRPVALAVVALAIMAGSLGSLRDTGLAVVGSVPGGLPALSLPAIRARDVDGIFPLALACLLLAYIEGVSAARAFADKHGYALDARQELLALGSANLLVALGGGYPVAGGLSQSAVNEKAGAKTPLALVFASSTLGLCLVFLTGLVQNLPKAVLAAIVLVAVRGLIDLRGIARLWRVSRLEFYIAMVALAGVLALGILKGILLAAITSILLLLRRTAAPHVAVLARIPGTPYFADAARQEGGEPIAGMLIFRVEAALLYFNVDNVLHAVLEHVRRTADLRMVVCDLSSSPYVDLAGARMLATLGDELAQRGVALRLVGVGSEATNLLSADDLEGRVDRIERFATIAEVVDSFRRNASAAAGIAGGVQRE